LLDNNTIKCWGFNGDGELGLGDLANRGDQSGELGDALPAVSLGTGRTAAAVVVGETNVCALLDNGQVKCWGFNGDGELGIGNVTDHGGGPNQMGDNLPAVDLGTGRTATQIAIGFGSHICALLDNRSAKCWGANGVGQLGQGSMATKGDNAGEMGDNLPPINLPSSLLVSGIAAASSSSCALLSSGQVKCWGINSEGELGLGDNLNRGTSPSQLGTALPFIDLGP
jgi:alpha-tubulin suppressor-like RCC1 family protein